MRKTKQWKAQRHTARVERKAAQRKAEQAAARRAHFVWVMSLEHPQPTPPESERPVVDARDRILTPRSWLRPVEKRLDAQRQKVA